MNVHEIRRLVDPFEDVIWAGTEPLTREEIAQAIEKGDLLGDPIIMRDITETLEELRARHVRRVAYFVVHDWTCPLLLDGPKLIDGHHRFAAALYRGDAQVEIQVLFS